MATVSDSSLLTAAQDIVTDFMDNKVSLNDGVIKKASDLGLNSDQTQRLIERTNTEAFLRVYPNDTEFDVASPEVVLGIKTASITPIVNAPTAEEGLFKAASAQEKHFLKKASSTLPSRYQAKVDSMSDYDIFGMDEEFFKEAKSTEYEKAIDPQNMMFCREICGSTKTASQLAQDNLSRELAFNDAVENLGEYIKQASLQGIQSIEESETELLSCFPDTAPLTRGIYDAVVTKMASECIPIEKLRRSNGPAVLKTASNSDLLKRYQELLNVEVE